MDDVAKVSVCVVTYNHERFLGECLDSILSQQTTFHFEVVVGEDCSTDATRRILLEWQARNPDRLRLVLQERNLGALENWRRTLAACRGEYIAHMDGDDVMLPGKLQRQVEVLDRDQDAAVVTHDVIITDEHGRDRGRCSIGQHTPRRGSVDDLVRFGTYFAHCSTMFRRACLDAVPLDARTAHVGDWLFHIQNATGGSIVYLEEVLGKWRRHGGGISARHDAGRVRAAFADQMYTLDRAADFGASPASIAYGRNRLYYSTGLHCLMLGLYDNFADYIGLSTGFYNAKHRLYYYLRKLPRVAHAVELIRRRIAAY